MEILDAEMQPSDFDYEGEMHTDAALDPELRERASCPKTGCRARPMC